MSRLAFVINKLYAESLLLIACYTLIDGYPTMMLRIKCFFVLLLLMILDTAPVPVVGVIAMYVLLARPLWFKSLVDRLYGV
jgi:hypothetical protein